MERCSRLAHLIFAVIGLAVAGGTMAHSNARAQEGSAVVPHATDLDAQDPAATFINSMIWRVGSVSDPQGRIERAESLVLVLSYFAEVNKLQSVIDDSMIDKLAKYLEDDNRAEDFWVAGALGAIGPRAVRAVPMLEAAHVEACAELPLFFRSGVWTVDAVETALQRITGHIPACR